MLAEVIFGILFFLLPIVGMTAVMVIKCVRKEEYAYDDGEERKATRKLKSSLEKLRYSRILDYQLIECKKKKGLIWHPHIKHKLHTREGPKGAG